MLRKNINLGYKKEIPLCRLADRNDMALGFFGVATGHPYLYTKPVITNEAKRNEESQINSNKNLPAQHQ
jgi:hypothetical protein